MHEGEGCDPLAMPLIADVHPSPLRELEKCDKVSLKNDACLSICLVLNDFFGQALPLLACVRRGDVQLGGDLLV